MGSVGGRRVVSVSVGPVPSWYVCGDRGDGGVNVVGGVGVGAAAKLMRYTLTTSLIKRL